MSEAVNPYADEKIPTRQERIEEIAKELARLKRKEEYLRELLADIDPAERARQDFIDEFYRGE